MGVVVKKRQKGRDLKGHLTRAENQSRERTGEILLNQASRPTKNCTERPKKETRSAVSGREQRGNKPPNSVCHGFGRRVHRHREGQNARD